MRSEKVHWTDFRTGVRLPSSPQKAIRMHEHSGSLFHEKTCSRSCRKVRSTGLEPVPVAGHAPQTCAYADSATTADEQEHYNSSRLLCQDRREGAFQIRINMAFRQFCIDEGSIC